MKVVVKSNKKTCMAHDNGHGPHCDCPECRDMKGKKSVHASIVAIEDYEDVSNDIPSDVARDVIFEMADLFGAESVLDTVVNWFSTWDLKPLADNMLDEANMKYEED